MRKILLALALVACSQAPLSIPLGDFSADVATLGNSSIVFQKTSQSQIPPTAVKSLKIEGTAVYQTQPVVLEFFASDGAPCTNQVGGVYVCNESSSVEKVGEVNFTSGATQSFTWSGTKLTDGINKGTLHLGVRLKSGVATSGTMQFKNLIAKVAIL